MGDPEPESIGDIQNYLEHFNPKEVGGVVISKTEVMDAASSVNLGSADATGTGQYFVDQTTGKSLSTFIKWMFLNNFLLVSVTLIASQYPQFFLHNVKWI